ncbi:MAG TPA: serine/threonine-protein kinase [Ktedonobacteraceae bacterium]|jgi:serine/threonine protein kinase
MSQQIGQQVGMYRLLRVLGEGGFASVYLGEHVHLETLAALKFLHFSFSLEESEAFRREAQLIARLEHPHIVRVLDYNVQAGMPFLVMSYAPGGTLRTVHPRGTRLRLPTVVDYVAQVAEALQYAHDRHVIHRDVKPENLLVGTRQEVLLSDFGIAVLAQRSRSISTQAVVGTAAYMAPEQFRGKPCVASDQYALAVVVYEWLVGERPFAGSLVELASQHLLKPPPTLREKNAGISLAVERVVLTALAKEPEQRFGSVKDFALALAQGSQPTTFPFFSPGLRKADLPHWRFIVPTAAVELVVSPTQRAETIASDSPAAGSVAPKVLQRVRRTALVKRMCLGLLLVMVLLWLLTADHPTLHSVFALAILLALILWIAAYADHRRAAGTPPPERKR